MLLGSRCRSPMLAPIAPRGPSSPEVQHFFLERVGYLGGAASRAQGRNVGEALAWWMTTQLYGTTTRTTTSSRFRCTCASSGNPVIYNLQLILFYDTGHLCTCCICKVASTTLSFYTANLDLLALLNTKMC